VIPQVLAELARVLNRTEADLRRNMTGVTDSPVFMDGRFISTGNFHALSLAADLDHLCIALAQVAELAGQHIHRLLDSRFSGLPDQLTPSPGPQAGLVVVHKRIVGAINELRRLAAPATVGLMDTSMGQEDAMTFSFEAAEKLRRCSDLAREVIACELLTCRQAWALRGNDVAVGLREHAHMLTAAIGRVEVDRPLGGDIAALLSLLAAGEFQV
jgi:histidine ammonia-lyase